MAEPDNLVLSILRELRSEIDRLDDQRKVLERRFDSIRLAVEGESFMGRCTAAEIEERLDIIDSRLTQLEEDRPQ